jgi:hypothetical protein
MLRARPAPGERLAQTRSACRAKPAGQAISATAIQRGVTLQMSPAIAGRFVRPAPTAAQEAMHQSSARAEHSIPTPGSQT